MLSRFALRATKCVNSAVTTAAAAAVAPRVSVLARGVATVSVVKRVPTSHALKPQTKAVALSARVSSIPVRALHVSNAVRACHDSKDTFTSKVFVQSPAPDFSADAVVDGKFKPVSLADYRGKWLVLFFYPLDFTFVCPTEIIAFSERIGEFRSLGTEVVCASVDSKFSHLAWVNLPRKAGGLGTMNIPIVADITKQMSKDYGVLLPTGISLRGLFIIDPNGVLRQITVNDLPIGRSVDETLRLVKALQFNEKHGEVCPADWKPGSPTMKDNPWDSKAYFSKVNK